VREFLLCQLCELDLLARHRIMNRREIFALERLNALFNQVDLALGMRVTRILNREESAGRL
jgi:hypothetical protein